MQAVASATGCSDAAVRDFLDSRNGPPARLAAPGRPAVTPTMPAPESAFDAIPHPIALTIFEQGQDTGPLALAEPLC